MKSFKDVPNKNLKKSNYPPDPYGEKKRKVSFYLTNSFLCTFFLEDNLLLRSCKRASTYNDQLGYT